MSSRWKSEWKSDCPIFALNRRVHSAARTFSGPPISLLMRLRFSMWFDPSRLQTVEWEGEISLFNNEFVLFCINNQAQVSVHLSNSCFERFFDAARGFYINSAPESNRLSGGNGGCVYPLVFFHKPLRRLHYCCHRGHRVERVSERVRVLFSRWIVGYTRQFGHFQVRRSAW